MVHVNHSPCNGTLRCSPCSGTAVQTTYGFRARGWTDKDGNLPLTYAFTIANPSSVALSSASTASRLQVRGKPIALR